MIFKKLKYKIKPNFSKDRIRPPLVINSAFLKKNTTTKSSANFLSPDSNRQGLYIVPHNLMINFRHKTVF